MLLRRRSVNIAFGRSRGSSTAYAVAGDRPRTQRNGLPGSAGSRVLTHTGRPAAVGAGQPAGRGAAARPASPSAVPPEDLAGDRPRGWPTAVDVRGQAASTADDGIELMVVLGGDGTHPARRRVGDGLRYPAAGREPGPRRVPGRGRVVRDRQHRRTTSSTASYTVEERFTIEVTLRDCETGEVVWSLVRDQRGVDREGGPGADARGAGRGRRPAAVPLGLRRHAGGHPDRVDGVRVLRRRAGDLAGGRRAAGGAAQRARAVRPTAGAQPDVDGRRSS